MEVKNEMPIVQGLSISPRSRADQKHSNSKESMGGRMEPKAIHKIVSKPNYWIQRNRKRQSNTDCSAYNSPKVTRETIHKEEELMEKKITEVMESQQSIKNSTVEGNQSRADTTKKNTIPLIEKRVK